jgi:hypothetical protein
MNITQLLKILKTVPEDTELYFIDSNNSGDYLSLRSVDIEYPADEEGDISVNICIEVPTEEEQ